MSGASIAKLKILVEADCRSSATDREVDVMCGSGPSTHGSTANNLSKPIGIVTVSEMRVGEPCGGFAP
jgi:hypothetical protein